MNRDFIKGRGGGGRSPSYEVISQKIFYDENWFCFCVFVINPSVAFLLVDTVEWSAHSRLCVAKEHLREMLLQ